MYTNFKPFSMTGLPTKISPEKETHATLKRDFLEELRTKEESAVSDCVLKIKLGACAEDGIGGCSTPKAVDHKMSVSLKCPPPPRKPKSAPCLKRKAQRDNLLDLSHELESLFPSNILRDFVCVQGLDSLKNTFGLLEGWSGDPCFPAPYSWIGSSVHHHKLLGSLGLSGLIPDFSSMNALQTIDLHNNSLRGPIPDFLGNFQNLKVLNLSNNQLNGTIPASLSAKKGLTLVVTGNSDLCLRFHLEHHLRALLSSRKRTF